MKNKKKLLTLASAALFGIGAVGVAVHTAFGQTAEQVRAEATSLAPLTTSKIEGAGIWLYLNPNDFGMSTYSNISKDVKISEFAVKDSGGKPVDRTCKCDTVSDFVTGSSVRFYFVMSKAPASGYTTTLTFTFTYNGNDYTCTANFLGTAYQEPATEDTITLDSILKVAVGKTKNITATTAATSVTWTSSDESVFTVSGTTATATVTGVGAGTATLKAKLENGNYAECAVTVTEGASTITATSINNWYGDNYVQISYPVKPTTEFGEITSYDATDGTNTYTGATFKDWTDTYGNFFVGNTIYTAGAAGNVSYLLITFYNASDIVGYLQYGTAPTADTITLPSEASVKVGKTSSVVATTGADAVTWTSSDENIFTVSGSGTTATITGVAEGKATLTGTLSNGASATCEITVEPDVAEKLATPVGVVLNPIGDGGYLVAFAAVSNASSYLINYYSGDTRVASNAITNGGRLDGALTGLTEGTTYTITITAVGDGSNYSNSDESASPSTTFTYFTAESYAKYLFNSLSAACDPKGVAMTVTETVWNDVTNMYQNVFYADRMTLKKGTGTNAAKALELYNLILGKYSESDYSYLKDFLETKTARPSNSILFANLEKKQNSIIGLVVVAGLVVTVTSVAFFIRKKKKQ